jgi:hypothetical protein
VEDWPTIKLITSLLEEHQASSGQPQIVTCMHFSVDEDVPLIAAAAERYNGQLYFLSADEAEWEAPPGPINPTRLALLQGIMSSVPGALPNTVSVEIVAGTVVARVEGDTVPPPPSLAPVLRAIAVIASDALQRTDVSVLVASAVEADARRKELLWRILNPDPTMLELNGRRTIVSIISGRPDPDVDYARSPAIKYVAMPDRVLKRTDNASQQAIRTFGEHTGPVVLFLGAGASASAGISLGNVYRDIALEDLVGESASEHATLADAFFQYLQDRDRFLTGERSRRDVFLETLTLERVMRETFHELGGRSRSDTKIVKQIAFECAEALATHRRGREALHSMIRSFPGRLIIMTVNFDQLVEVGMEDQTLVVRTPDEFRMAEPEIRSYLAGGGGRVPILKLHGSIEDPTSLVASIDSTAAGLNDAVRAVLDAVVAQGPNPTPWFWIGCSMRDRDVNDWLRSFGQGQLDEWWVDPFPGVSLDLFVQESREAVWRQGSRTLQDRLVIDSSDRFLSRLSQHVVR